MTDHRRVTTAKRRVGRALATVMAVSIVSGVALMGCSSGDKIDSSAATTTTAATVDTLAPPTVVDGASTTVKAQDNLFAPEHLQIKEGTKVTFVNDGHNQHDLVATDPSTFDFSIAQDDFDPGEKATFTFSKPGTYEYYCSLHATPTAGSMRGVITVTK